MTEESTTDEKKNQNSSQNQVCEKAVIRVANKHLAHLLRSLQELI